MRVSQTVNTLATLSLVFAFVFAPAGAILGHLGLAQIRRTDVLVCVVPTLLSSGLGALAARATGTAGPGAHGCG